MALGQAQPEESLHHGGEVDAVESGQPAREFGVVQGGRVQAHFGQAGQVLVGGVQDPFVSGQHVGQWRQDVDRAAAVVDRVDQDRAGPGPTDLDQVGTVGVTETGGPFGVDGEGTVAG